METCVLLADIAAIQTQPFKARSARRILRVGSPGMVATAAEVRIAFFGTSIMEHFEAHDPILEHPYDLPAVGDQVTITQWRKRGWVHQLYLAVQVGRPTLSFEFANHGLGGATTRDLLTVIEKVCSGPGANIAVVGAGINDVWRCFQGRPELAVHESEFQSNMDAMLSRLSCFAGRVLVVSETPFGWDNNEGPDIAAANQQLDTYNQHTRRLAAARGATWIDLWAPFLHTAACLPPDRPLWSDGAHLSELGDTLVASIVTGALLAQVDNLTKPSN